MASLFTSPAVQPWSPDRAPGSARPSSLSYITGQVLPVDGGMVM